MEFVAGQCSHCALSAKMRMSWLKLYDGGGLGRVGGGFGGGVGAKNRIHIEWIRSWFGGICRPS